jgi:hypothetical protein
VGQADHGGGLAQKQANPGGSLAQKQLDLGAVWHRCRRTWGQFGTEAGRPGGSLAQRAEVETRRLSVRNLARPTMHPGLTGRIAAPRWCPKGLSKTQRRRLQKMRQKEIEGKHREEERGCWFDQA